jgi:phosphoglycerate dehydrogenase-like enzyme
MKIAVTTVSFSSNKLLIKELEGTGLSFKLNPFGRRLTFEELVDFLTGCDCAIIGLDKISDKLLKYCPSLKVISKYGVGIDNIDFEACKNNNVKVIYPRGINKRSVSEMALSMMISLARNISSASLKLKNGNWVKDGGFELSGKTVGIIGFGNIGKDLAHLLKPFKVKLLVNDIDENAFIDYSEDIEIVDKNRIFNDSDFISIHTPLSISTKHLINQETIESMKPGVILINTARVSNSLKSGHIGGLGIDAYEFEPIVNPLFLSLDNVICTPHIGGNSEEAVYKMGFYAINALLNE